MQLEQVYFIFIFLSCTVAVVFLLDGVEDGIFRKIAARRARRNLFASLPEVMQRSNQSIKAPSWRFFDDRIEKAGISSNTFLIMSAALALSGAMVGLFLLKDFGAVLTLSAGMVFVALLALDWVVEKRERKMLDQLPAAIQLFAVEYDVTKSVEEAMSRAAKGMSDPLRGYMEQCVRDLKSGKSLKSVLDDFAGNVGHSYGRLWAQMLLAAAGDMTVVKVMPRLIERLSKQKLLQQKNMTELSGTRRIAGILNVLVIPCFILVQVLFPESSGFFNEPLGRIVVAIFLLSLCVGIMLDRLLQKVDF